MVGQVNAIHIPRNALSLFTLFDQKKNAVYYLFVRFVSVFEPKEQSLCRATWRACLWLGQMKITKPSRICIYSSTEGILLCIDSSSF